MRSDRTELDARYERIYQAWASSDIPSSVLDTPDWQNGCQIMIDWYSGHMARLGYPTKGDYRPSYHATWANEVHIFSHMIHLDGGHSLEHAAIEEEGTRLVLEWWAVQVRATAPTD